ncbi:hypothetical protein NSS98_22520 [Paenibacillus sp. FSL E2-0274]|uniref:hypothetical protein n=1 Tax=Paenibacillus TaxID=44249 RepID=UPI00096C920A|nr:hypothetical protein [Paenibacillus odorifer]OME30031.1 hypothetical protein BSK63_18925 [Paenibacillus odorifer]
MFTALFRTFDNLSEDHLYELSEVSLMQTSSERITDLIISEENITLSYYRTIRSVELFYDFISEAEVPEFMNKAYKASCIFSKNRNRALIYGNRAACSNFERYLKSKAHINFSAYNLKLSEIFDKLINNEYQLRNLEYLNVEFLGTVLKSLSLEFKTNLDAKRTMKIIQADPSKAGIEVFFNKNKCILNIDLTNGAFKVEYDSLHLNNLEEIKEMILAYFEEE